MPQLEKIQYVYFIGIGGIGMSALARWFNAKSTKVSGYDLTATPLTKQLCDEGILIHFEDNIEKIPDFITDSKKSSLIVYTPAVPSEHKELNFFKDNGFKVMKRSEVLGLITKNMFTIAVAGTHGKTTISSMIAHILNYAGLNCTALIGGISINFHSNILINNNPKSPNIIVVEADEYDRSFLTLQPDIAVISSIDADHLDVYGNVEKLKQSFCDFINQIKPKGRLIIKKDIELDFTNKNISIEKYSTIQNFPKTSRFRKIGFIANNIRIANSTFIFDVESPQIKIDNIKFTVPGYHNVENALAAICVAIELGVDIKLITKALEEYKGVTRRFEYIIKSKKIIFIDDYAHHPSEITAFINSVRAIHKNKELTVIFQPHLYSRTKAFARGFSNSLSKADKIILMDIYPARETPIKGVSSEIIFKNLNINDKILCNKDNLLEIVTQLKTDILVTLGAGDIDKFIEPIKEILLEKYDLK